MVIQHNMGAAFTSRQLNSTSNSKAKSTEKLSSGYQINRAADDAAGLSISEKMRKQIRGLDRGGDNINDGISYCQIADGALGEVQDMLVRLKELSVQAANGTNSASDREAINDEVNEIKSEMNRIFYTTTFNGERIWDDDKHYEVDTEWVDTYVNMPTGEYTTYPRYVGIKSIVENVYDRINITNDNKYAWPVGNNNIKIGDNIRPTGYFNIAADENGIKLNWTGYNGKNYESEVMEWPEEINVDNTISFSLADHLNNYSGTESETELAGINVNLDITTTQYSDLDDLIDALNGKKISAYADTIVNLTLYDENGNELIDNNIDYRRAFINYSAALKSDMNLKDEDDLSFTNGTTTSDTSFIEGDTDEDASTINKVNLISAPSKDEDSNYSGTWKFQFYMEGIGKVIAEYSYLEFWKDTENGASDADRNRRDIVHIGPTWEYPNITKDGWWGYTYDYRWDSSKGKYYYYPDGYTQPYTYYNRQGDVVDVVNALTSGVGNDNRGGILTDADKSLAGGRADPGYLTMHFILNSENAFQTSSSMNPINSVGSLVFKVKVTEKDSLDDVINRIAEIQGADIYTGSENSDVGTLGTSNASMNLSFLGRTSFQYEDVVDPVYANILTKILQIKKDEHGNEMKKAIGNWKDLGIHTLSEADQDVKISLRHRNLDVEILGLEKMDVLTEDHATAAIDIVNYAGQVLNEERARFGAYQNRLEHTQRANANTAENTTAAESRIRDADMAREIVKNSKDSILEQAGQSMLAQANQSTNGVLSLLQ